MNLENRDLFSTCLKASDYRSFLSEIFTLAEQKDNRFSYASFSRKAGFTSRGFVKEVVSGRKRLTAYSFPRFVKALSLPAPVNHYFSHLVALEEEELNTDRLTADQLKERIKQARSKAEVLLQAANTVPDDPSGDVLKGHQVLEVISVLGNPKGIEFDQVVRRTRLDPFIVANVLKSLIAKKIVKDKGSGLYVSINPHFIFENFGEKTDFKNLYLETLSLVKRKVMSNFAKRDHFFYQSYFSVDRNRMPELKERMRKLLQEFVQAAENDDGDTVAKIHFALFD